MKKPSFWGSLLLIGLITTSFAGCGSTTEKPVKKAVEGKLIEVKSETEATLVPLAKAEGKVVVYSVTGRIAKAAEGFEKKYGIKVERSSMGDNELIEKVAAEGKAKEAKADFVIAQDAGRVWGELLLPGYLENYVPAELVKVIPSENQKPLVFAYMNKVFMYNRQSYAGTPITNVWQLADPAMRGRFTLKDPKHEGINLNFLTMLTKPENAVKLAQAYESLYNRKLELTTENAGYEWIKRVWENGIVLGSSDTSMTESIGLKEKQSKNIGLLNFSKIRYAETKNLALGHLDRTKPFDGFYYPEYALLMKGAKHPAAAKLFVKYLLTQEGYRPWQDDLGTYSGNTTLGVARGDKSLEQWKKVLVGGEPRYIYDNRDKVMDFIQKLNK